MVNDALRMKVAHDARLRALDTFIDAYEAEHGVITREEMDLAIRRMRSRAVPVRALPSEPSRGKKRRIAK